MPSPGFSDRLDLVLKALSLSRGRFAADLGVDKSLVGRWCSGAVTPSSANLARLTQAIAALRPGFTLHDWDSSLEALAERFGVETAQPKGPDGLAALFSKVPSSPVAPADGVRGAEYEGFWRSTRLAAGPYSGQFVHDHVMLRNMPGGGMSFTLAIFDVRFHGWAMSQQHQIFAAGADSVTGTFVFAIFNGVVRQRAQVVDGLILTCLRDPSGTPIACKCHLTRVGELTGDDADDEAAFAVLAGAYPYSMADEIPQAIRDHIWNDTGPTAFAAGGDQMLMMDFARSLARGPIFEDTRPAGD
jgi:transcriptional regulator with XRE-family HTH domain